MKEKKRIGLRMLSTVLSAVMLIGILPMESMATGIKSSEWYTERQLEESAPEETEKSLSPVVGEIAEKRTSNEKHFRLKDGTTAAAIYDYPVHYENDGEWKEIDNSLNAGKDEENIDVYENENSPLSVKFAKNSNSPKLVSLENDNGKLSWSLINENARSARGVASGSQFKVKTETTPARRSANAQKNAEEMTVKNAVAEGVYENILPDVDMQYIIKSNVIKENIILKSKNTSNSYSFEINHNGLLSRIEEDGSVTFYNSSNPDKVAFVFATPFATDSNGAITEDVHFNIESGENKSILTVTASEEWLQSEDRVYPVVIDPYTKPEAKSDKIMDTFVREKFPNSGIVAKYGSFLVGKNYYDGTCRSFIKFNQLPQLNNGDIIYDAYLEVVQYDFSTNDDKPFNVAAYEPLSNWNEGQTTWNNQPAIDNNALDYVSIGNEATYRSLNITKLVRKWYNTGINNGVMLKSMSEGKHSSARFFTSDYPFNTPGNREGGPQYYPAGVFYYKNATGVEDYWNYHEQSAGTAGTGYTNDFTGNTVWVHNVDATAGSRMPVSMDQVYNLSESNRNSVYGNGWGLSCEQYLSATGIAENPYVYTDADGTKHYFYRDATDGKYKDEDGLGLVYDFTGEPGLCHKITTKDKIELKFNEWGRLRETIDSNGNKIKYNYDANHILRSVEDGAGQMLTLHYTSDNNRLSTVTDSAGRTVVMHYDDAMLNLTSVIYPDGTTTFFEYDGTKLVKVISSDGYTIEYQYENDLAVPRVSRITEKSGNQIGQTLKISYQNGNVTVFEDNGKDGNIDTTGDNILTTFNFDNFGRPTDIYNADGNANTYEYYSDGLKNNKLSKTGRMQKTVYNMLDNPGMENRADNWYTYRENSSSDGLYKDEVNGYIGNNCAQVYKWTRGGKVNQGYDMRLNAGTYTFSAYVRTIGVENIGEKTGAALGVYTEFGDHYAKFLTGTTDTDIDNGWQRQVVTFTLSQTTTVMLHAGLFESLGIAMFDCFQLEYGDTANKFNLIENGSFENGNGIPSRWNGFSLDGDDGKGVYYVRNGGTSMHITGKPGVRKMLHQRINTSGSEGDVYNIGGWIKANALPNREFAVQVAVTYTIGNNVWYEFNNNPNTSEWQYFSGAILTDDKDPLTNRTYTGIEVFLIFNDNCNSAYYEDIQLIKDEAESFVYDNKGNVSTASSASDKSGFEYDNNDNLTKMTQPTGESFEYVYDGKKNLISAKNAQGVKYDFGYDSYGNPVNSTVKNDTDASEQINSSMNYTANGNQISTVTDSRGKITSNEYDSLGRLTTGIIGSDGKRTSYAYDNRNDNLLSVSKTDGSKTISNTYGYSGENLSSIGHNDFQYNFEYDGFGNLLNTKVGNQLLSNNVYLPNNGMLEYTTFGNGQVAGFKYDMLSRVIQRDQNGQAAFKYKYDSFDSLLEHQDLVNDTTYNYQYDLTNRFIGMDSSKRQSLRIKYDNKNRLDSSISKVQNNTVKTQYLYAEKDSTTNKPFMIQGIKINDINVLSYNYDSLSRVSTRTLNLTSPFTTTYTYLPGDKTNSTTTIVNSVKNGNDSLNYVYDDAGNILTISENGTLKSTYNYDGFNQLTSDIDHTTRMHTEYVYDNGGNISSKTTYSLAEDGEKQNLTTVDYGYSDSNWKDKLTSYDGETITYDAIGNPLNWRNGETRLSWKNGRQLAGYSTGRAGGSRGYVYNDEGLRTQKVHGASGNINYFYNGSNLVTEEHYGDQKNFYYDESDNLIGFNIYNEDYYYVKNLQNDIIGILDKDGNEVVSYTYDAWGKQLSVTGTMATTIGTQNPFRYRGYYYDFESGFYYLNSRYYDPAVGRFLNADDISVLGESPMDVTDKNVFAYCDNNPITRADDDGDVWNIVAGAVVGGLVGGAMSGITSYLSEGKVNWKKVAIGTAGGAISGGLAASGLGYFAQIAGNAFISGASDALGQASGKGYKKIDLKSVAKSTAIGAITGIAGGRGASNHVRSSVKTLNKGLTKKLVKSIPKKQFKKTKKAVSYYYKSTKSVRLKYKKSLKRSSVINGVYSGYAVNQSRR